MELDVLVRDWRVWNQICRSEGGRFGTRCSAQRVEGLEARCAGQKVATVEPNVLVRRWQIWQIFRCFEGWGPWHQKLMEEETPGKLDMVWSEKQPAGRIGRKGSPADQAAV